jgi:hypothetical protein
MWDHHDRVFFTCADSVTNTGEAARHPQASVPFNRSVPRLAYTHRSHELVHSSPSCFSAIATPRQLLRRCDPHGQLAAAEESFLHCRSGTREGPGRIALVRGLLLR